ncbi:MAG: DUF1629 domain-containing protein [Pseudomonadota bacterium]
MAMVYGLNVKPLHGYYIESKPLDGNFKDAALLDDSADEGLNPRGRTFTAGRPIDGVGLPTRMQVLDQKKNALGDFDASTLLNVSGRAKALIEEFEPDRHQFFPVEFIDIDGEHLEDRWFFIVCNRLDSVHRDRVEGMLLWRDRVWTPIQDFLRDMPDEIPAGYDTDQPTKLVFSLAQIGEAKVWRDKHFSAEAAYLSSDLTEAIERHDLTGLRLSESGVEAV